MSMKCGPRVSLGDAHDQWRLYPCMAMCWAWQFRISAVKTADKFLWRRQAKVRKLTMVFGACLKIKRYTRPRNRLETALASSQYARWSKSARVLWLSLLPSKASARFWPGTGQLRGSDSTAASVLLQKSLFLQMPHELTARWHNDDFRDAPGSRWLGLRHWHRSVAEGRNTRSQHYESKLE